MDKSDVTNFLLDLGKCFYRTSDYENRFQPALRIESVSEFGIGFASCFLVADHVVLETLKDGADPILLDMYDLMGFAAAKKGGRTKPGTTVTLHLKSDTVQQIEGTMKGLQAMCPHLDIPLVVNIDGLETVISSQPFKITPDDLLVGFFKHREPDFIVECRHFELSTDSISGYISILFNRKNGIMIPGGPAYYKLQDITNMRVSQLGFTLPSPQHWPLGFFKEMNNTVIYCDLDLHGEMRLELDPSRTKVLPSPRNRKIIKKIDEYFTSFILDLHKNYWSSLHKEQLFEVYKSLSGILRLQHASSFLLFDDVVLPLVDLFVSNMPLEVVSNGADRSLRTWDEIRASGKPVAFFRYYKNRANIVEQMNDVVRMLHNAIIVIEYPENPMCEFFWNISDLKGIYVSDFSKRSFKILEPWRGAAVQMKEHRLEQRKLYTQNYFNEFLVPFIPATPYALISSVTQRMSGGVTAWINSTHPKILSLLHAAVVAEKRNIDIANFKQFLAFIHRNHIGLGSDPDYVMYVQEQQRPALNELVAAGVLTSSDADKLLLSSEDFVPWEKEW